MQKSQKPKHNSAFTIDSTGHYVSSKDGFVVPKDFTEFYERFPKYVKSWVGKHIQQNYQRNEADTQDWESELTLHLMALPEKSSKRKKGFVDIISCFDPMRLGGANSKSFFFYVNTCLKNYYIDHLHKKRKDAIHIFRSASNVSFDAPEIENDQHENTCDRGRSNQDIYVNVRVGEFKSFVEENEPELLSAVEIIFSADTIKETASKLGLTVYQFRSVRERLKMAYECFERGLAIPKKKRNRRKKQKGRVSIGLSRSARSPRRSGRIDYAFVASSAFASSGSAASGAGVCLEK
jgi:hypothetical protein